MINCSEFTKSSDGSGYSECSVYVLSVLGVVSLVGVLCVLIYQTAALAAECFAE